MKKKEEDLKRARERITEAEKKEVTEEEQRRRLQTIIKQKDAKINVFEGKIKTLLEENEQLRKKTE